MSEDLPAHVEEYIREDATSHGHLSWLGLRIDGIDPGRCAFTIPYTEQLTNDVPGEWAPIHGGVLATLVDTSSYYTLTSMLENPQETYLSTTNLNVNYVRPATADLHADAQVVRLGESQGVTDVTISAVAPNGEEKTVVTGSTVHHVIRPE